MTAEKTRAVSPLVDTPIADDEITLNQAAARLTMTRVGVLRMVHAGSLPAVRRLAPPLATPVYYVRVSDVDASQLRPKVANRIGKPGPKKKRTWSRKHVPKVVTPTA